MSATAPRRGGHEGTGQPEVLPGVTSAPRWWTRAAATLKAAWRTFRSDRVALLSLIYVVALLVLATLAPLIVPHDPAQQNLAMVFAPPSLEHPMGTDQLGRDILSKMMYGTRTTFTAGAMALIAPILIGVPIGIVVGYVGGLLDDIVMRIFDGLLAFPGILLALAITGVLGVSLRNTMIAISVMMMPIFARLARGQTKQVCSTPYVYASRLSGGRSLWIMRKHVLPNILSPIIVQASFSFSIAVLVESALSFLGLGAQAPQVSWGTLLSESYGAIYIVPWMILFPSLAITTVILASNSVGDGLRVALDPRMRAGAR